MTDGSRPLVRSDSFAGLVAHELAHARLIGEEGVAGLGVSGSEEELLTACWSTMCGEPDPPWARHLEASVRDALVRGPAYRAAPRQPAEKRAP